MNCYDQLQLLRDYIGEASAAQWTDVNLVRRLNAAQRKIAIVTAMSPGNWLIKSASVTPVASVITLPVDCSKPVYLEETSSGAPISWLSGGIPYRRVSRGIGTSLDIGVGEAYPLEATIEVNKDSYTTACTLWYQVRVPDLQQGTAAAGGALSLTFPDDRNTKRVTSYYAGTQIEVISGTGVAAVDLISAYTATMVATVGGTYGITTLFGTISRLPEETHHLIVLEAAVIALMKPASKLDKEVLQYYLSELRTTRTDVYGWLESRTPSGIYTAVGDPY